MHLMMYTASYFRMPGSHAEVRATKTSNEVSRKPSKTSRQLAFGCPYTWV